MRNRDFSAVRGRRTGDDPLRSRDSAARAVPAPGFDLRFQAMRLKWTYADTYTDQSEGETGQFN